MEDNRINSLETLFLDKVGDRAHEIQSSEGLALMNCPIKISMDISEYLYQPVFKEVTINNNSENKNLNQLQKIVLQASSISESYERYKIMIKGVIRRIQEEHKDLVTVEELKDAELALLRVDGTPNEFFEEEKVYQEIIQTYCTNAAIKSGIFSAGAIINVEELEKTNSRVAIHAKKTAFDQICLLILGHYSKNYDKLDTYKVIQGTDQITDLIPYKLKSNNVAFAYISAKPMIIPEFPRFAKILNQNDGYSYEVTDKEHFNKNIIVNCTIAGQEVKVEVPIWYGIIIGTKAEQGTGKTLNFNDIIGESHNSINGNDDFKMQSKIKENSFGQGFSNIVTTLAESNESNYASKLQSLRGLK